MWAEPNVLFDTFVQPPPPPPPPPPPLVEGIILDGATNYTVVRGDTLAEITGSKYGKSNMYFFPLIRLANSSIIPNPDVIEVGTDLVIPDFQRNRDSVGANIAIREDMLAIAAQYAKEGKPKAAATLRNLAARLSK